MSAAEEAVNAVKSLGSFDVYYLFPREGGRRKTWTMTNRANLESYILQGRVDPHVVLHNAAIAHQIRELHKRVDSLQTRRLPLPLGPAGRKPVLPKPTLRLVAGGHR